MKIAVLIKEVPDTFSERSLNLETGLAERGASEAVLDEITERALEVALSYVDGHADTEVTVVSLGPESASKSIRKALAMGANAAVHVADDQLVGADLGVTAQVLASVLASRNFDLVLTGNLSTDGSGGVIPSMLAELLDLPALTSVDSLDISAEKVSAQRTTDTSTETLSAPLPAIVSITEAFPDARFPNFKGIMAAKKKPYEKLSLGDLGIDVQDENEARSIMVGISEKPARTAGIKITDNGDAGVQIAEFLASRQLG